jgi:NADPH:quinone reductase-like Zn-dependent oxidoreductase
MHAVLLKGYGGFEQLEYRDDVPIPVPRAGEVLVKIGAAGVNNTDINTRTGWYAREAEPEGSGWTGADFVFPRIQGADACGRIVAVGPGVAASRLDERVLIEPLFCVPGSDGAMRALYFGSECDGAFADYARVPAAHAWAVHTLLSDAELASFPCAYSTAENLLTKAHVRAGETVLVTGASGGVGSAAVQLARRRGAVVIAVAGASKHAAVAAVGAARVVARGSDLKLDPGIESVDVVVDVVGGDQFGAALDVLKRGGRYAVAGAIGGPTVMLDLRTLYLKDLRLLGCTVLEPGVFANLVGYIERGEIRPLVAAVHPLHAIVEAQREFLGKHHIGKIVLVPEG